MTAPDSAAPSALDATTSDAAPATIPPGYSPAITGFRGLGSVIVVVVHVFLATKIYPAAGSIRFLSIVMPIFFVISAYSLYRPFVDRQLAGEPPKPSRSFWWKRFLRIYPLYGFALTIYLIVLPGVRPPGNRIIDYVKLYGFGQIYDPDLVVFSGIPAAWFLCDEVVFYFLLPGIAWLGLWLAQNVPGRRPRSRVDRILRGHALLAAAMIVVGQATRIWLIGIEFPSATTLPFTNMDFYGTGILLALASLRLQHAGTPVRPLAWIAKRPWIAVATLVLGAIGMNAISPHADMDTSTNTLKRYVLYLVIVIPVMTTMTLGDQRRSLNRVLASPRWNFLALLSLHVYLWHQLFIGAFDRYITESSGLDLGGRYLTGIITVVGFCAVTIAWSALWRPLLDYPYSRWSSLVPRSADAAPLPAWLRPAAIATCVAVLAGGVAVSVRWGGSPLTVTGGTGLVTVTDARSGDQVTVRSGDDTVARASVGATGAAVLSDIEPGRYDVVQERGGREIISRKVTVKDLADHPSAAFYETQRFGPGMHEIETRDGTRLAAYIHLPGPVEKGPYPTVVELSAYRNADPTHVQTMTALARALGFATVSVNTRGTGCSGGAFDMLGDAEAADGYDVVEAVAQQPWVQNGSVGLVGFSFSGMAALQAASAAPPSLNSVVALSVYGDAYNAFHPGGLANSGFPVGWLDDMLEDAEPSGAPWIRKRIEDGDDACARNQALHGSAVSLPEMFLGNEHLSDRAGFERLSPSAWADQIRVPIFLGAQLQDATVGSDLAEFYSRFKKNSPYVKMVLTNGTHGDGIAAQMLERVHQFMVIYVARATPQLLDLQATLKKADPKADPRLAVTFRPTLRFPADETPAQAWLRYETYDPVELLVSTGGGDPELPGAAVAMGSITFPTWPPPSAAAVTFALAPEGQLNPDVAPSTEPMTSAAIDKVETADFRTSPTRSGDAYNVEGSNLIRNTITPWRQPGRNTAVGWISQPMAVDRLLVGNTTLDLWVKSSAEDADLQAVMSEVSPEGNETEIQVGFRRLSELPEDAARAPGGWRRVSFDLGPVGHLLHAGTRLRVQVGTPGDGQVQWSFAEPLAGPSNIKIGQHGPLSSVLNVRLIDSPQGLGGPVPCGALRAQPCRVYVPSPQEKQPS